MRLILHQRTKFREDQTNDCGDIAIFLFFKMTAVHHLGFV